MGHEEIALAVTKKLRLFTLFQRHCKMFFDCVLTLPQPRGDEFDSFFRRIETKSSPRTLVERSLRGPAVDGCRTSLTRFQLSQDRFAQTRVEELRDNKQIGFHQLVCEPRTS